MSDTQQERLGVAARDRGPAVPSEEVAQPVGVGPRDTGEQAGLARPRLARHQDVLALFRLQGPLDRVVQPPALDEVRPRARQDHVIEGRARPWSAGVHLSSPAVVWSTPITTAPGPTTPALAVASKVPVD